MVNIIAMLPDFKVIIAGGQDFNNYEMLKCLCDMLLVTKRKTHRIIIVCGMATGADMLGKRYAEENGWHVQKFPAAWRTFGRRAGPYRNKEMAIYANALIAFWDGNSPGTKNMIENMKSLEKLTHVQYYNQPA